MSTENLPVSVEEHIKILHESICEISNTIGFSIEVTQNNIPQRHIDVNSLMDTLLENGMEHVNNSLRKLAELEELLKDLTG